ncbi:hypothetical protein DOU06_05300 [Clavibacter michiganensis subsp. michiganensis]|nr:hypothetical protein [Clavibacter michiganensis subsp. michiganensis]
MIRAPPHTMNSSRWRLTSVTSGRRLMPRDTSRAAAISPIGTSSVPRTRLAACVRKTSARVVMVSRPPRPSLPAMPTARIAGSTLGASGTMRSSERPNSARSMRWFAALLIRMRPSSAGASLMPRRYPGPVRPSARAGRAPDAAPWAARGNARVPSGAGISVGG